MDERRKVRFAENDDVFVLPYAGVDSLGLDSSSQISTVQVESDADDDESFRYGDMVVDIRERMRDCVITWSGTPCWRLLEGSVDDDDGEAKDVQKYVICFARLEVDGDCPRGLERQLCRSHHEARKQLQEVATTAVLSNEFRLRREYGCKKVSDDDIWKELRQIYKEHSRGAKAFARKMGKADQAAVQRSPVDIVTSLELIEELRERARNGSLRIKRVSSSESTRNSGSNTASSRSTRSLDSIGKDSDHSKKDGKSKKERKGPPRIHSITHRHGKVKERSSSKNDMTAGSDDAHTDHAADLFHEVDKKGKTKRSSRWRSLKKGISKRVNSVSHRTQ
jgi:hypothetical protein